MTPEGNFKDFKEKILDKTLKVFTLGIIQQLRNYSGRGIHKIKTTLMGAIMTMEELVENYDPKVTLRQAYDRAINGERGSLDNLIFAAYEAWRLGAYSI